MHILIISDAYPPMRTSCATQIYDLAQAFIEQGRQVSVIIPAHLQKKSVEISDADGPTVYAVRCFKTKDVGYAQRAMAEFINPFLIGFRLKRNPSFMSQKIDQIVWYSPTIFWGPLVKRLKTQFSCKSYLILRDIFPDWAKNLEAIKGELIYRGFRAIAHYQYAQADRIGVQSPNNLSYLVERLPNVASKIEVLWNWIGAPKNMPSNIDLAKTKLAGKYIFVYAGNMGVAQGVDQFIELAKAFNSRDDIGFLFLGRGSHKDSLERRFKEMGFQNALFFDEIDPAQLNSVYKQCHAGLISLDFRHETHNIPGKFLSYLHEGLPVIGFVNPGNDLIKLVDQWKVGVLFDEVSAVNFEKLNAFEVGDIEMADRCKELVKSFFLPQKAATQIATEFQGDLYRNQMPVFDNSFNVSNNFGKLDEIGKHRELYKENSLSVLSYSSQIRHFEPSLICSADDTSGPNQYLLDLILPSIEIGWRERITDIDLIKSDGKFFNVFPGEHYRLLKAITKILDPKIAIEIGTYTGMGTVAISQGLSKGCLYTFDIFPWNSMESHLNADLVDGKRIIQHVADLSKDGEFNKYQELFDRVDLIFLDAPKDGVFEYKILDLIQNLQHKDNRILIMDDIRFVNMIDLWRKIDSPKLDITSFGHWSGTGLVDIREGLRLRG